MPISYFSQISRNDSQNYLPERVRPGDFFHFEVSLTFCFTDSNGQRYSRSLIPSTDPMFTTCSAFFSNARDFLLDCVPTECKMLLSTDQCNEMVDCSIIEVQSRFPLNVESHPAMSSDLNWKILSLSLDIVLDLSYDEVTLDTVLEEMQMEESMQDVRMIPASKESIEMLLKDSKITNGKENNCCAICLEELYIKKNDGEGNLEVSVMPCDHEFHKDCIKLWLQTSHVCPLCRYSMPVDDN